MADAARLLGRRYRLIGRIITGRGKGRQLGFPTANLLPAAQIIPTEGVYAGFVAVADSEDDICLAKANVPAVFSIGQASTFGDDYPLLVEAHLLVENVGKLEGKWMAMDFVDFIRHQHKFKNIEDLQTQIARDCEQAKIVLATEDTENGY